MIGSFADAKVPENHVQKLLHIDPARDPPDGTGG